MIFVRYKLREGAKRPLYRSDGAAGVDLHALLDEPLLLAPGESAKIPTGIAFEIPAGYEGQVRSRAGLAFLRGLTVLDAPGTIDSDYHGEVPVLLHNVSPYTEHIESGDRIAQIVFSPVARAMLSRSTYLEGTTRGESGSGSTGDT